jgi:cellulose synthase/poly-beta-1,6-N-acetylglucosamine synthase-like glycosyltransferase
MPGDEGIATSVVVSTYDEKRWNDLNACLRSLEEQTLPPLEVIVVVDHNDGLLSRVSEAFPAVRAIANARSRGLAGARNTGIDNAGGSVIAFIDDDARAKPRWLERLSESFEGPAVVGAGGALVARWEVQEPRWFPPEFLWVVGCSYTGLPETLAPVRNPIGANMAVRTAILREVGGFREGTSDNAPRELRARGVVRAGGNVPDDTDLAIRISQRRPDAVWLHQPQATVFHTVTPERASPGYFLRRSFEEGVGKASLAGLIGSRPGLASERRHAAVILPRGVLRELRQLTKGDPWAALRVAAIAAGTLAAAAGFLSVMLRSRRATRVPADEARIAKPRETGPSAERGDAQTGEPSSE